MFKRITTKPLQVINYTELLFAFVAHIITIPILGVLTGLICGCAVHYTIQIQQDGGKPATRKAAFWGVIGFKTAQLWIHQTSFLFVFTWSGKTLPFGWPLDTWAWIVTVFIFSIDVWALTVTAQEAAERAEAADIEASLARAEQHDEADRAARLERERLAAEERLEAARIRAEAKTATKLAAEETARKIAEASAEVERNRVELERIKVETERKNAEDARKLEEKKWNDAETRRKEEEAERKKWKPSGKKRNGRGKPKKPSGSGKKPQRRKRSAKSGGYKNKTAKSTITSRKRRKLLKHEIRRKRTLSGMQRTRHKQAA